MYVFEGVIGTKDIKVSVDVQEASVIRLPDGDQVRIELPDEDCPEGLSILLRRPFNHYPVLYVCGKSYILTSEGLKEVSIDNPFVKKE